MKKNEMIELLMRDILPYGMWTQESGAVTIFNRSYNPIARKTADGKIISVDSKEWVEGISTQEWFYNDACTPWHNSALLSRCLLILDKFHSFGWTNRLNASSIRVAKLSELVRQAV